MAELVAGRHHPAPRAFYWRLVAADHPKKRARTAAMGKLLVILKAVIRDTQPWRAPQPSQPLKTVTDSSCFRKVAWGVKWFTTSERVLK
jgi:hypothetical protein